MKQKLFLIAALAVMLVLTCISANAAEAIPAYEPADSSTRCSARGDYDDDGSITSADARMTLRAAVGLEASSPRELKLSDMDSDGFLSASDARLILRIAAGISDAPGHIEEESITLSEVSCTQDGITALLCGCCNKLYDYGRTASQGHVSAGWVTVEEPDCVKAGLAQKTCVYCGEVTETRTLGKRPHQFGKVQYETAPSCVRYVNIYRVCAVCSTVERSVEAPAGAHSWVWKEVTPVTCVTDGSEKQVCSHCGAESGKTRVITCIGSHDIPKKWSISVNHTCTEDGLQIKVCRRCNEICEQEVIPAAHLEQKNSRRTIAYATCTQNGSEEYYCLVCRQNISVTLPARGHTPEGEPKTTPATCTQNGVSVYTCSECRQQIEAVIEAKGHTPGEWQYVEDEEGEWLVLRCAICTEELERRDASDEF